ncbi:MAG: CRISPR-associated protein Cas4 [Clostridiales bacterium]|nr:CRISPR-associated protein Cas4 [Clostridiales bacterium]
MILVSDHDGWVPISALQHYAFCPRQCALIHVEQVWEDNIFTLRGQRLHAKTHAGGWMDTKDGHVVRGLPLWSEKLGLIGQADVVEFREDGTVYPVEYKSGPRQHRNADEIQLCAQAMCLEEMLGVAVAKGAIYYHGSRRRREVALDKVLRSEVMRVVDEVKEMLANRRVPPPVADERCRDCSLFDACLPFSIKELQKGKEDVHG